MTERISDPKLALDYPILNDDHWVLWVSNEHLWPDARRVTRYLTDRRTDPLRGYALFTSEWCFAKQFTDEASARTWLSEQQDLRKDPYRNIQVTTVAQLKKERGYA